MAKKRSNPFAGDGQMSKAAWNAKTSNESVKVMAHTRLKPQRRVPAPGPGSYEEPENVFPAENSPEGPQAQNGLVGGGNEKVNHLKAAIGLLGRSRV